MLKKSYKNQLITTKGLKTFMKPSATNCTKHEQQKELETTSPQHSRILPNNGRKEVPMLFQKTFHDRKKAIQLLMN